MNQETFMLKWKFYEECISLVLNGETIEGVHTDVTLFSDEMIPFKAHKFVLSANSTYMKEILLNNPHPNPSIYLKGIQKNELQTMLQIMYYGEATLYKECIENFFNVLEEFQFKSILLPSRTTIMDKLAFGEHRKEKSLSSRRKPRRNTNVVDRKYDNGDAVTSLFSCSHCDYNATDRSNLRRHEKSIHEGIRYECRQCEYKATRGSYLKVAYQQMACCCMLNTRI